MVPVEVSECEGKGKGRVYEGCVHREIVIWKLQRNGIHFTKDPETNSC